MFLETSKNYNPETRVETFVYGEGKQRYGFVATDPSQPVIEGEELYTEKHLLPTFDLAVWMYLDYLKMGYLVGPLMDYEAQVILAEQWLPPMRLLAELNTSDELSAPPTQGNRQVIPF